jgi:hypothetical protein
MTIGGRQFHAHSKKPALYIREQNNGLSERVKARR